MTDSQGLWLTLADSGWHWLTLADSCQFLMTLDDSGSGRLWLTMLSSDDFFYLWPTLADSGWLWLTLAASGWIWPTVANHLMSISIHLMFFFWQFNMSLLAISCLSRGHLMSWSLRSIFTRSQVILPLPWDRLRATGQHTRQMLTMADIGSWGSG